MRLAITGAAGFLGGHLVREATSRGHDVVAVVRPSHDPPRGVPSVRADLGEDRADLATTFADCDAVLHAAGRVTWGTAAEFGRDNADATGEVARAAGAAGIRMVHVSTTAVYGDRAAETGRITEDAPFGYRVDDRDRYGTSKIDAELRLKALDVDVSVVRPGFILGPGDRNSGAMMGLVKAPATPLVGRGHNRLPLTYVGSVVDAILRAATAAEAGVYNIAGDWSVTQRQYFSAMAEAAGTTPRFVPIPYRAFFAAGLACDVLAERVPVAPPWSRSAAALLGLDADFPTDRARAELDWQPAVPFDEAIRRAVGPLTG